MPYKLALDVFLRTLTHNPHPALPAGVAKTLTPAFDLGCRTTVGVRGFRFYDR